MLLALFEEVTCYADDVLLYISEGFVVFFKRFVSSYISLLHFLHMGKRLLDYFMYCTVLYCTTVDHIVSSWFSEAVFL